MAQIAEGMLRDGITALIDRQPELAQEIIKRDKEVDQINKQLARELTSFMLEDPSTITRALNLTIVARCLERVADHCKNIAEEVYYLYAGGRHPPRAQRRKSPRRRHRGLPTNPAGSSLFNVCRKRVRFLRASERSPMNFPHGFDFAGMHRQIAEQAKRRGFAEAGVESRGQRADRQDMLKIVADGAHGEERDLAGDDDIGHGFGLHVGDLAFAGAGDCLAGSRRADHLVDGGEAGEIEARKHAQKTKHRLAAQVRRHDHLSDRQGRDQRAAVAGENEGLELEILEDGLGVVRGSGLAHADARDENVGAPAEVADRAMDAVDLELVFRPAELQQRFRLVGERKSEANHYRSFDA